MEAPKESRQGDQSQDVGKWYDGTLFIVLGIMLLSGAYKGSNESKRRSGFQKFMFVVNLGSMATALALIGLFLGKYRPESQFGQVMRFLGIILLAGMGVVLLCAIFAGVCGMLAKQKKTRE